MKKFAIIFTVGFFCSSVFAQGKGTLEGKVKIKSKGVFGKKGYKKNRSNVVIFIEDYRPKKRKKERKTLKQKNKKFKPRVLPIVQGGIVSFPNSDPYNHNVFSPTPGRKFDLDYYGYGKTKKVRFKKTGSVRIYCNIHSSMVADVLVVPNRYYAKTKKSGKFKIKGIPPGKYTVVAWQPTGASEKRNVVIKPGKTTKANFTVVETVFKIKHKNKYGKAYAKDY